MCHCGTYASICDACHTGVLLILTPYIFSTLLFDAILTYNCPPSLICAAPTLALAAGLGEARLRDLNDEINKLFREKGHWERQIKTLGGPDYASIAPKVSEADGQLVPGGRGYRYFGAAKDLPGVRELFVSQTQAQARRTRGELYKHITPDYYGYRDEEDGTMLAEEEEAQGEINAALRADAAAAAAAAPSAGSRKRARAGDSAEAAAEGGVGEGEEDEDLLEQEEALASSVFRAHVPLPSQRDLEAALLEKKKKLVSTCVRALVPVDIRTIVSRVCVCVLFISQNVLRVCVCVLL